MKITESEVAGRRFIHFGDSLSIPVDRIKSFDFQVPNGGATGHSVKVETDDPNEEIFFAYGNCDAVRDFLQGRESQCAS